MDYYEELQEENIALKELLDEAMEFLKADLDGLRNGVSTNGRLSGLAEDAHTVAEIRAIELWLIRAAIEMGRG